MGAASGVLERRPACRMTDRPSAWWKPGSTGTPTRRNYDHGRGWRGCGHSLSVRDCDEESGMRAVLLAAFLGVSTPALASTGSVLLTAPDDPRAITVKGVGDGRADDTAAVQKAIDAARDKTGHGV